MGVNFVTILALQLLYESARLYTQKEVCEKLGLPKQFINSVVKSLWEQGYVQLKEARDRRNKKIILTDAGKDYAVLVLKPLDDAETAAWEGFSDEDLVTFTGTMERYTKALGEALRCPPVAK